MRRLLNLLLVVAAVGLLYTSSRADIYGVAHLNLGYIYLLRAGLVTGEAAPRTVTNLQEAAAEGKSSALWGLGLLARWQGDEAASRALWEEELALSSRSIPMLHNLYRKDEAMARMVHQRYPQSQLTGFWLGETLTESDVAQAIAIYEETMALGPVDGVRWVELGWLYRRNGQNTQAMAAYDRGCRLHDRGGNGCWQAGLLSQELGLNEQAADYYRLTLTQIPNYGPALERLAGLGQ